MSKENVNNMLETSRSCIKHNSTNVLDFTQKGRKFQKGRCLGHSIKGCTSFSGIDLDSGQLVYITEWNMKYVHLEAKGVSDMEAVNKLIQNVEDQASILCNLHHKNIVSYECVQAVKDCEGIIFYLVQDFVQGTNVSKIFGALEKSSGGAISVAKGVLEALAFLEGNKVAHKCLNESTVFIDHSGSIRITDFSLVPYLQEFMDDQKKSTSDLTALGTLIYSLSPVSNPVIREFIDKCHSGCSISELQNDAIFINVIGGSRLHSEFKDIQNLGQGAYGSVVKGYNIQDGRLYAIKRIPLSTNMFKLPSKITREVALLSELNHENIVRYYNSWTEYSDPSDDECSDDDFDVDFDDDDESDSDKVMSSEELIEVSHSKSFSFSDGITFEHCIDEKNCDVPIIRLSSGKLKLSKLLTQTMYIQMEFCENSTLKTAIDEELYTDQTRVWRLVHEILKGLSYIHRRGIIHRDLKPLNIFLDSKDQVKIGDFGLAIKKLQASETDQEGGSLTDTIASPEGQVGTELYVAPEICGCASEATYNEKVDLYSLGIILFEMSLPPYSTAMERYKTLTDLRKQPIDVLQRKMKELTRNVEVIQCLLQEDPGKRSTAEDLLISSTMGYDFSNGQEVTFFLAGQCFPNEGHINMREYHFNSISISYRFILMQKKLFIYSKYGIRELKQKIRLLQRRIPRLVPPMGWASFVLNEYVTALKLTIEMHTAFVSFMELKDKSKSTNKLFKTISDNKVPNVWQNIWQGPETLTDYINSVSIRDFEAFKRYKKFKVIPELLPKVNSSFILKPEVLKTKINLSFILNLQYFLTILRCVYATHLEVKHCDLQLVGRLEKKTESLPQIKIAPLEIEGAFLIKRNAKLFLTNESPGLKQPDMVLSFEHSKTVSDASQIKVPLYSKFSQCRKNPICWISLALSPTCNRQNITSPALIIPEEENIVREFARLRYYKRNKST